MLSEQVQKRRLDGGDRVHGRPQIEGLGATAARVTVGEGVVDRAQNALVVADAGTDDQTLGVAEGPCDAVAARHLTEAGASLGVLEDDDVPGEVRGVGTGEVQEHGVPAA